MRALIVVLLFLSIAMGCATPTQRDLDAEVKRLCAIDGGITVYEQVTLPPQQFDKYGHAKIPLKRNATPLDKYYLELETHYYKRGGYDDPSMWRSEFRAVRRSDGKVLGRSVSYTRAGGDIPGPWHPTSFTCPPVGTDGGLISSVFVKGGAQ